MRLAKGWRETKSLDFWKIPYMMSMKISEGRVMEVEAAPDNDREVERSVMETCYSKGTHLGNNSGLSRPESILP